MSRYSLLFRAIVVSAALLIASCTQPEDSSSTVNNATVTSIGAVEGNTGQTTLAFTVSSSIEQRIRYRTTNVTAAAGSDFLSTSGEWGIQPGSERTINVPVNGDLQVEADEQLGVILTYSDGSTSRHTGTIFNDDRPSVIVADQPVIEGAEDTIVMRFKLTLSQKTLTPFPVRVLSRDESAGAIARDVGSNYQPATANQDYQPIDRELIFPAGSKEATVDVIVNGDTAIERSEAFSLRIYEAGANPLTATPLGSAFGIISNDDGPGFNMPTVTLRNGQAAEGSSGSNTPVDFLVSLDGPNEVDFSIFYEVVRPTSTTTATLADGSDLPATTGKFRDITTSNSMPITGTISVPVIGDNQYELNEAFELVLRTGDGYELARAQGSIQNDDAPNFSLTPVTVEEGNSGTTNMLFTLLLAEPKPLVETITLDYRTRDGFSVDIASATSGQDYQYTTGQLTFSPGDTSKTIVVPIIGDLQYEPNEAFSLQITQSGVVVVTGKGEIENDDNSSLKVTPIDGSTVQEARGTPLVFSALFERSVTRVTTVYYEVDSRSADVGLTGNTSADITNDTLTGHMIYDAGRKAPRNDPISLLINDDTQVEGPESFAVSFYANEPDMLNRRNELYQSTISIIDNDFIQIQFSTSTFQGEEGNGGAGVTLAAMNSSQTNPVLKVSNGDLQSDAEVTLTISDSGTVELDDYELNPSFTFTVPAGNYNSTVAIPIPGFSVISDTRLENNESVTLQLSSPDPSVSGLDVGIRDTLTITIENDDTLQLGFSTVANQSVSENGATALIGLSALTAVDSDYDPGGPGGQTLNVSLGLLNPGAPGNAELNDFTPSLPVLLSISSFPIDVGTLTVSGMPAVLDDNLVELDEAATLQLAAGTSSLVTVDSSTESVAYTLSSDDTVTLTLDTTSLNVAEGSTPSISVTTSGGTIDADSPDLPFEFTVSPDPGTESADYVFNSGAVMLLDNAGTLEYPTDWLTIEDDNLVESPETLTVGLSTTGLSEYIVYSDAGATKPLSIISDDILTASFSTLKFESLENDDVPLSVVAVTGSTEIDVLLLFERLGGESYPATEGVDFALAQITVPSTHTSGDAYPFPAVIVGDTNTEFNESIHVALQTPGISGEPADQGANGEAILLIVNDDQFFTVNGSGINYCADGTGNIVPDCTAVSDASLRTQDGKYAANPFSSTKPPTAVDSAEPALTWQCLTDDRTNLTWAYEVPAGPAINPQSYNKNNTDISDKISDMDGVCENTDWRQPTFSELANLMTFKTATALLDTSSEFTDVQVTASTDQYWFQDSDESDSRLMSFHQGQVSSGSTGYLMLVSDADATLVESRPTVTYACAEDNTSLDSTITSDHRYTVAGERITDNLTGLTWAARSLLTTDVDNSTWGKALNQADAYEEDAADATGWRAPTIKELLSLLTLNCDATGLAVDTNLPHFFLPRIDGVVPLPVMSSSPVNNANNEIWTLDLSAEAALLSPSLPPSSALPMQTFVVRAP